jgi:nitrogen fixation protein NifZ
MVLRPPRFQWGQPVQVLRDLRNDGSYPDCEPDELLEATGTRGEIARVGCLDGEPIPVYLVSFPDGRVVGCFEEEIGPV